MTRATDARSLYEELADEYVQADRAERGTMMGFPCLRRDGAFFASLDPKTSALILKLPADRVATIVSIGDGKPFAPNGRTFREWVALLVTDRDHWSRLLAEAWGFASTSATQA